MKKINKILSVVMVLAMLSAMFVMNIQAAEGCNLKLTTKAVQTKSNPDIYKVTLYAQADKTLSNINLIMLFDKTAFKLIRNTGVANTTATNTNGYLKEGVMADENVYDGSIAHPVYGTSVDSFSPNYGYAIGVGSGSFTFQVKPAAAAYGTLDQNKWQAMLFDWSANWDDNALLFDCKAEKPVMSFYLQKLDTAADGNYEVGVIAGCKKPVSAYDSNDAIDTWSENIGDTLGCNITCDNAVITVGAEEPALMSSWRAQIRNHTQDDNFDYRIISDVTSLVNEIGAENLDEIGFVFATRANVDNKFDYAKAKALAEGTAKDDGAYHKVAVNYITTYFGDTIAEAPQYALSCYVSNIDKEEAGAEANVNGMFALAYAKTTDGKVIFFNADDKAVTTGYSFKAAVK